jgi:hypothetical protein
MFARDVHTNVLMVVIDAYMATSLARASERVLGFGALRVLSAMQACRWVAAMVQAAASSAMFGG